MSRFAQIPEIPAGLPEGLTPVLAAMKQNLELMAAQRGADRLSASVLYGAIKASEFTRTSAGAAGDPPTQAEFDAVVADLEQLATSYNYLLAQLRGEDVGT